MIRPRHLLLAGALACAACNTTPKNDIAAMEAALTAGEAAAYQYTQLPPCGAASTACFDPAVGVKIRAADNAAYVAIKTAESVAANVSATQSAVSNAMTAAQTALGGLQAILTSLPAKGQ